MKKLFVVWSIICNIFFVFSAENKPEKEKNPQDTVKVYYLDEVVVT